MNFFPLVFSIPRLIVEEIQMIGSLSSNKEKVSTLSTIQQINQSLSLGVDLMNTTYLTSKFSFLPLVLLEEALRVSDIAIETIHFVKGKTSKKQFITAIVVYYLSLIRLSQEYQQHPNRINLIWILSSSLDIGVRLFRSSLKNQNP